MEFSTVQIIMVVDQNPEFADLDNPQGYIYRDVTFLLAEARDGRRWIGPEIADARDVKIAELAWMKGFDVTAEWGSYFPVYGSGAYEASGQMYADAFAERAGIGYFVA